jgi:hypothetical protein
MLTGACTTITLVPLVMHKRRTTLDTAVLPLAAIRSKHVTRSPPSWSQTGRPWTSSVLPAAAPNFAHRQVPTSAWDYAAAS